MLERILDAMKKEPDAGFYLECLYEMIENCADYVSAVVKMEAYRNLPLAEGNEYREELSRRDKSRSVVHNDLISKIHLVNRICTKIGVTPPCGDDLPRAEYGDFAFRIAAEYFEHRVR